MSELRRQANVLKDGPERLLDAGGISVERMPLLHAIFDRMLTQCSESLRALCSTPAIFTVASTQTERMGDILSNFEGRVVVAIFQAPAWDSRIILGFDHNFLFSMAEALFGGDGTEPAVQEDRPPSNIEMRVGQAIFDRVAKSMQASFSTVIETTLKFETLETRMDFAVIVPRGTFAIITTVNLQILDRIGEMYVVLPQPALNAIRQGLAHDATKDTVARDPRWVRQMQNEITRSEVKVKGMIEERQFTLGDIADLKVGQILQLQATAKSRVKLECNSQALFWCQLGQADGHYTLRVDDVVDKEQEFMDDILPH
ncbi:flagellar motor switch protein FliM [Methyloferula stellata]|uniref:flagellar motor switch protein FliM n=1 Tax=Methyloferula stellata TaxID=876270 RepID=UPI0003A74C9E|nr:FliM/FliN family flagellar motor switch protein [Methyloferula stellata]